ncbi:MAG TPA: rod shape-determining protein RodA [Bacillota bacterium]|nr:rod shape-determining protein RodA [Bacillota bacterium]
MLEKKLLKNLDITLIIVTIAIIIFGLIIISSATHVTQADRADPFGKVLRQSVSVLIGMGLVFLVLSFNYEDLGRYWKWLYGINIALLLIVELKGRIAGGAQSWIEIGPLVVQPSEFAKISIIITFAHYLSKQQGKLNTFWNLVPSLIHFGVPMFLILIQPDLGTALVFVAIMFGMLFVAGARPMHLLSMIGAGIAAFVGIVYAHVAFGLKIPLEAYQIKRLTIFLDPYSDPAGAGYHVIQSQIAIGSGGLVGKGLFKGMQNQLNFLPAQHTDFIFSVVGEELGFIGASVLLGLFLIMVVRMIRIAAQAKDTFGTLMVTGVAAMIVFHILVNVGMTVSMMPITGIPLPFFSYGGSSMMTNLIAVGIVLNVHMRRQKLLF